MTTLEVLIAARAKIEAPERWTKNAQALDSRRDWVEPRSVRAACWCAYGAIAAVTGGNAEIEWDTAAILAKQIHDDWRNEGDAKLTTFNDDPGTTHADVLALFDKAIKAIKAIKAERAKEAE